MPRASETPFPGPDDGEDSQSPTSPIWLAAIERYYGELAKGGIKASVIDKDIWNIQSPDELIAQIEALGPVQAIQSNVWAKALRQLQTILLGLNDFAMLTAWVMGMNGKVAAVLWGSIRLIIKVCASMFFSAMSSCPISHMRYPKACAARLARPRRDA